MILLGIASALLGLSFLLLLWQWFAARRFPLHQTPAVASPDPLPGVTLFKPLKDCDEFTATCLRSWLAQDYAGNLQVLFGVERLDDPVCAVVNRLLAEFPHRDAQLVLCPEPVGANPKVSKLVQLDRLAKHDHLVISDADVAAPPHLLANLIPPLRANNPERIGLVNCFYRLAAPTTPAMHWEAVAVNTDFWSQVLQGRSLQPLDFALGAAMATTRARFDEIGGFRALADCIADDYQLGHRIAQRGWRIELCPLVVDCWSAPLNWRAAWRHQLRWARTIRVCKPLPYFLSILSNTTLWTWLWLWVGTLFARENEPLAIAVILIAAAVLAARGIIALDLERRLLQRPFNLRRLGLASLKDLLHALIWAAAFLGNRVDWRGDTYQIRSDGTLKKI